MYTSEEHEPIESLVTTLTRTKLASVGFVAASNCMRQHSLDDTKSLLTVAARSPQRHATRPTHQTVPKTTLYYKVLLQYYSVLF